jgi:hypothetical protein
MKKPNPYYLNIFLFHCRLISHVISRLHCILGRLGILEIPACISDAPGGLSSNLQKIWFARILKKLVSLWVRSPFRQYVFQLIQFDFEIPCGKGLILVTCHTPWKRLLVRWFFENHYALIIDTAKSIQRQSRLKMQRKGHNELAHIIRHLRLGGRVIIAADVFNKSADQPAEIMGKRGNLSLLPARLARIAGVPMLAAVPQVRNGAIHICPGPRYDHKIQHSDMGNVMQNLLGFFESEIKKDPSIWSYFVNDPLSLYHKKRIE